MFITNLSSMISTYIVVVPLVLCVLFVVWISITSVHRPHPVEGRDITSTTGIMRAIRRHDGSGDFHKISIDAETSVVLKDIARVDTTHWALTDNEWHDSEHPIDALPLGKRHADNPFRVIVPADWRPPIGDIRIALLDTITSEYKALIIRRPQTKHLVW